MSQGAADALQERIEATVDDRDENDDDDGVEGIETGSRDVYPPYSNIHAFPLEEEGGCHLQAPRSVRNSNRGLIDVSVYVYMRMYVCMREFTNGRV